MTVLITVNAQKSGKKLGPVYIITNTVGSQSVLSVIETNENDIFYYQLRYMILKQPNC